MKQQITLSPVSLGNHTVKFSGDYYDKSLKMQVRLLSNGRVAINRELTKEEQVFTKVFSYPTEFEYVHNYEDTNKDEILWAEKLKRHVLVKSDGNTNCLNPIFQINDSKKNLNKKVEDIKLKLMVGNMINGMRISEMCNIAYYKGEDISKLNAEQIYLKLCDFNTGILMKNPQETIDSFYNPDKDIIITVNKAIVLEVIKKVNGQYYIGQEIVGKDVASVVGYCKSNKQIYENFIQREVENNDKLPIDMNEDSVVDNIIGMQKGAKIKQYKGSRSIEEQGAVIVELEKERHDLAMQNQEDLRPLREEGKKLGVPGWRSYSIRKDTLEQQIAEKKKVTNNE